MLQAVSRAWVVSIDDDNFSTFIHAPTWVNNSLVVCGSRILS